MLPIPNDAMPIPTFDRMLRPLLAIAATTNLTRREAASAMAGHFKLTPEEAENRIPSGGTTYVHNRAGWAMTFLTKGGLIAKVAPRTYRATDRGLAFLREHPSEVSVKDLEALNGWHSAWQTTKSSEQADLRQEAATPLEALDNAVDTLNADLKTRVLAAILEQSPTFFEQLVLDVLLAMGYGGSRADAAQHLGKTGDEGVDGAIKQDPLGLDLILVQAKRYAPERTIDRKTLQTFFGSMTGQGITKGIFITTSRFNENAQEFVARGSQTKVVLIDGAKLLDLMLRHHIGVRVERQIEVLELDQNYFADEE
jgi:restriction system protein